MIRAFVHDCGEAILAAEPAPTVSREHAQRIDEGATRFLEALEAAPERHWQSSPLAMVAHIGSGVTPLGRRFCDLAPGLPWTLARGDSAGSQRGIVMIEDLFDISPVKAGLLLMLPESGYPEHNHPPQELYVILDGTAAWRFGGSEAYVDVSPGTAIYNPPAGHHGTRSRDEAVLSMFVLWDSA